jgi:hypothetical protein
MNTRKDAQGTVERLGIQEKALSELADTVKKQERDAADEIHDLQSELKALKMFLSRTLPEFKKEFPEIQRKVK